MSALLQIRDESALGQLLASFSFQVPDSTRTLREVIAARVRHEVESFNAGDGQTFRGLVMPEGAEQVLNGYKLRGHRDIDGERQVSRALEAFEKNGFLIIVNDRQIEDLDEVLEISEKTTVSFVKLVPLVGG